MYYITLKKESKDFNDMISCSISKEHYIEILQILVNNYENRQ